MDRTVFRCLSAVRQPPDQSAAGQAPAFGPRTALPLRVRPGETQGPASSDEPPLQSRDYGTAQQTRFAASCSSREGGSGPC